MGDPALDGESVDVQPPRVVAGARQPTPRETERHAASRSQAGGAVAGGKPVREGPVRREARCRASLGGQPRRGICGCGSGQGRDHEGREAVEGSSGSGVAGRPRRTRRMALRLPPRKMSQLAPRSRRPPGASEPVARSLEEHVDPVGSTAAVASSAGLGSLCLGRNQGEGPRGVGPFGGGPVRRSPRHHSCPRPRPSPRSVWPWARSMHFKERALRLGLSAGFGADVDMRTKPSGSGAPISRLGRGRDCCSQAPPCTAAASCRPSRKRSWGARRGARNFAWAGCASRTPFEQPQTASSGHVHCIHDVLAEPRVSRRTMSR